jgi:hypothetical protein
MKLIDTDFFLLFRPNRRLVQCLLWNPIFYYRLQKLPTLKSTIANTATITIDATTTTTTTTITTTTTNNNQIQLNSHLFTCKLNSPRGQLQS